MLFFDSERSQIRLPNVPTANRHARDKQLSTNCLFLTVKIVLHLPFMFTATKLISYWWQVIPTVLAKAKPLKK